MKYIVFLTSMLCGFMPAGRTQLKSYQQITIAFYNAENLYDTVDNTAKNDEDFLPQSKKHYDSNMYQEKISHIATTIAALAEKYPPYGASVLGMCEVENDTVLNDLVQHPLIRQLKYHYVIFDGPDVRGVDVALLYNPSIFKLEKAWPLFVWLPDGAKSSHSTRDILYVNGLLAGENFHFFINHWPSRLGGSARSAPARIAAASVLSDNIRKIKSRDSMAKIVIMGDFNDNPDDVSIRDSLVRKNYLFNPFERLFATGAGSLAHQDAWGLFDQIIISDSSLREDKGQLFYYRASVFNAPFLQEQAGRYRGYPKRFFGTYGKNGGYSDHFPATMTLIREVRN